MSRTPPLPAPTRPLRRRLAGLLLAAAAAAGLISCGGDEEPAAAPGSAAAGAFPVTVTHKYGRTEIPAAPRRVVTLGLSDHDIVLALGTTPVGVVDWFGERPFGKWPWQQPRWAGAEPAIVGERDEYNFEKIAALSPDLIVAQYSGMQKAQYQTLSKIAPTVGQPVGHDDYGAPWQDMTRAVGAALGKPAEAAAAIAGIDERFAEVRAEHPEFARLTAVVGEGYEPGKWVAFSPTDPKTVFLTELGFRPSAEIEKLAGGRSFAEFSSERLDLIDVDRVLWLTDGPAAERRIKSDQVYRRLAVAREDRALFVPYEDPPIGAALSFNTVLSIPYAIDQVLPLVTEQAG